MPKELTVKNKDKSVTIKVPEVISLKAAVAALSERRVLALVNLALERCYRDEARRRMVRGDDLERIPETLAEWMPPGELPPLPAEKLLEQYKKLPQEQQELFKNLTHIPNSSDT